MGSPIERPIDTDTWFSQKRHHCRDFSENRGCSKDSTSDVCARNEPNQIHLPRQISHEARAKLAFEGRKTLENDQVGRNCQNLAAQGDFLVICGWVRFSSYHPGYPNHGIFASCLLKPPFPHVPLEWRLRPPEKIGVHCWSMINCPTCIKNVSFPVCGVISPHVFFYVDEGPHHWRIGKWPHSLLMMFIVKS